MAKDTPPPGPTDINDLLAPPRARPPQPPASSAGRAGSSSLSESTSPTGSASPESPVSPRSRKEKEKLNKRTFNLKEEIDTQLSQLSYWSHGEEADKTYNVNKALEEYLAKFPKSRKPIPKDAGSSED